MYKVIIVDDEQLTRTFLTGIIPKLHSHWTVVGQASDGAEALELLKIQSVDLVITDIKMPIMDGVTLCQHISRDFPNTQLIILSGYGEFEYAQKALRCHVVNYLLKPINNDELAKALNTVTQTLNTRHENSRSIDHLVGLSSMFKKEIAIKFLQAVINDSYVNTQALLPLIYEHNKTLLTEEGLILIISPSINMIKRKNYLKNQDLSNLLIYQTTKEQLEDSDYLVFLDQDSYTIIYTPYEQTTTINNLITSIVNPIFKAFHLATNYDLSCYVGKSVSELLQLNDSYTSAKETLINYTVQESFEDTPIHYYSNLTNTIDLSSYNTAVSNYIYAVKSYDKVNIKHAKAILLKWNDSFSLYLHTHLKASCDQTKEFNPESLDINTLLTAFEHLHTKIDTTPTDDSVIDLAKQYIQEHYDEPISLSIIADYLSISPSYLSNIFHETVGTSYIKYLTELRLQEASLLLRHKRTMTLDQITQQVGYLSVKHFSYVFKKKYKMTPGQYRKNNMN